VRCHTGTAKVLYHALSSFIDCKVGFSFLFFYAFTRIIPGFLSETLIFNKILTALNVVDLGEMYVWLCVVCLNVPVFNCLCV